MNILWPDSAIVFQRVFLQTGKRDILRNRVWGGRNGKGKADRFIRRCDFPVSFTVVIASPDCR